MLRLSAVLLGSAALFWTLLLRNRSPMVALSAWRWLLAGWGFLLLVTLVTPIHYVFYRLSTGTAVYVAAWVAAFCLGDVLGAGAAAWGAAEQDDVAAQRQHRYRATAWVLAILGLLGSAYLALQAVGSGAFSDSGASLLGTMRAMYRESETTPLPVTIATVAAFAGLVASSLDLAARVSANQRPGPPTVLGLVAYVSVYVLAAGRFGVLIGGLTIVAVAMAAGRLVSTGYGHWRAVRGGMFALAAAALVYVAVSVTQRAGNWGVTLDDKIAYDNERDGAELEPRFREGMRTFGLAGDFGVEMFYYFSPQLYGLDFSLGHYSGTLHWGANEFHFIARRLGALGGPQAAAAAVEQDQQTFEAAGLGSNFFRTAVHSTYLDFGLLLSLPLVFGFGWVAGRWRVAALRSRSALAVARQGLVCAGAAFSIIFSPFAEVGWSYPLIWFLLLGAVVGVG